MLIFVASFVLKVCMTSLQMAEVFTAVDLRQFWSIQLELLICIICEILPPLFFIRQHMKNNKRVDETRLTE